MKKIVMVLLAATLFVGSGFMIACRTNAEKNEAIEKIYADADAFYNEYGITNGEIKNVDGEDRLYISDVYKAEPLKENCYKIIGWRASLFKDFEFVEETYFSYSGDYVKLEDSKEDKGFVTDLYYIPTETLLSRFDDTSIRDEADKYEIHFNPIFGVYASGDTYSSITLDDMGNCNSSNILDDRADSMRNNFTISLYQE